LGFLVTFLANVEFIWPLQKQGNVHFINLKFDGLEYV